MFALWNEFDASLIKVSDVKEFVKKVNNVENVVEKNVTYDRKGK